MKAHYAWSALLALTMVSPALAGTSVRIGVGFGAPAPVVTYRQEPRWVMVPGERVWYADDDDLDYDYFRYGGFYWIYENDNWYRARRYNGPFYVVRSEYVPVPVWRISDSRSYRWHHRPSNMPPGIARQMHRDGWRDRDRYADDERGNGRGRGHGRGRGR